MRARSTHLLRRRGFTILELEVAIILLAFGVTTLASLLATQGRVLSRLRGNFNPGSTICVTRSADPWVKRIGTPARITAAPFTETPPASVAVRNNVTIVSHQVDLSSQGITVTADATEVP